MNKDINIAIVGLGQVGIYLYNELKTKSKEIENKTGKKIQIVAISAKNKNKKRKFKINKKIFYSNPLKIINTDQKGCINIIDLANIYSCGFIATNDIGSKSNNGFCIKC